MYIIILWRVFKFILHECLVFEDDRGAECATYRTLLRAPIQVDDSRRPTTCWLCGRAQQVNKVFCSKLDKMTLKLSRARQQTLLSQRRLESSNLNLIESWLVICARVLQ